MMNLAIYIKLLRPTHWLKNLMLFFPPFLSGAITKPGVAETGCIPFVVFCLASSSTYILNDILDRDNDVLHPVKKLRPIPSGQIPLPVAGLIAIILFVLSLFLAINVSLNFFVLLLSYAVITILYSLKLKEVPIIDMFCISVGFLLRLKAGGEVFNVPISEWLFFSVLLLSIFLSIGKRLCELTILGDEATAHRKSLSKYPAGFLEGSMYMTGGAVLVTYTMYVISRHAIIYTVPLCCLGLMRYTLLIKRGQNGDPVESLLHDGLLLGISVFWALIIGWGIYK